MPETSRRAFLEGAAGIASLAALQGAAVGRSGAAERGSDDPFGDGSDLESTVDELLADRIGEETPGATVAVVDREELRLAKGYGVADAETGSPVQASETTFRIGSVAKLLTFTAVMHDVERGSLDLDADVNTYLDDSAVEIPDSYDEPVTLRHLGTHTAGFGALVNPGMVERAADLRSLERVVAEDRPARVRAPGETVAYSNYGTALAGHVVAAANDTTFEEYVQSEIYDPVGMEHSTFNRPGADADRHRASPHTPAGDGFEVPEGVHINWRPAGSMTATATDMARFMRAHLADGQFDGATLLAPETVTAMHNTQFERHPAVNNVGYGFWEYGRPEADLIGHSGATLYFLSALVLAPSEGVGVFVSYNSRGAGRPGELVEELLEEYGIGFEPQSPEPLGGSEAERRAEQVAGEYAATVEYSSGLGEVTSRLEQPTITAVGDGRLTTDDRTFAETEPYVYREVDGTDVLAFDVADGAVQQAHRSSVPEVSFEPVPPTERRAVVAGSLGVPLAGFGLSTLGYGGLGAWRWWQRRRGASDDDDTAGGTEPAPETADADTEEGFE